MKVSASFLSSKDLIKDLVKLNDEYSSFLRKLGE